MNKTLLRPVTGLVVALLASGAMAQAAPATTPAPEAPSTGKFETPQDRLSYAVGADVVRNLKKQDVTISIEQFVQGARDAAAGAPLQLNDKDLRQLMQALQSEVRNKMVRNNRLAADDNKRKGLEYMTANKAKPGVVTLPSGLQYRVVKEGKGSTPLDSDMVEVHYKGMLLNGEAFDASAPGKHSTLKVSALISGWKEALKLMRAGSRWELVIPPNLAYGERGQAPAIGPNETLLFEVELVGIKQ